MGTKVELLIFSLIPVGLLFVKVIPLLIRIAICLLFALVSAFSGFFYTAASSTLAARIERVNAGGVVSKDWLAGSQATRDAANFGLVPWLYSTALLITVIIFLVRELLILRKKL